MFITFALSICTLIPFNKYVKFGPGFMPFLGKLGVSLVILSGPATYMHKSLKVQMTEMKMKAFELNKGRLERF